MDWHWPRSASLSTASQGLSLQKHALVHTYINTLSQQCPSHSGANAMHNQRTHPVSVLSSKWAAPSTMTIKMPCYISNHFSWITAFWGHILSVSMPAGICVVLTGSKVNFIFFSLLLWPHLSQPLESHNSRYQSRRLTADTVSRKGQKVNTKQGRNILSCNKPQHKTSI